MVQPVNIGTVPRVMAPLPRKMRLIDQIEEHQVLIPVKSERATNQKATSQEVATDCGKNKSKLVEDTLLINATLNQQTCHLNVRMSEPEEGEIVDLPLLRQEYLG